VDDSYVQGRPLHLPRLQHVHDGPPFPGKPCLNVAMRCLADSMTRDTRPGSARTRFSIPEDNIQARPTWRYIFWRLQCTINEQTIPQHVSFVPPLEDSHQSYALTTLACRRDCAKFIVLLYLLPTCIRILLIVRTTWLQTRHAEDHEQPTRSTANPVVGETRSAG
jgi:hypothetical protein